MLFATDTPSVLPTCIQSVGEQRIVTESGLMDADRFFCEHKNINAANV